MVIAFYFMAVRKLFYDSLDFREAGPNGDVAGRVFSGVGNTVASGLKQQMNNKQPGAVPTNRSDDNERGAQPSSSGNFPQLTTGQMLGAFAVAQKV